MSLSFEHEVEKKLSKLWIRYGSSKRQRDALYFGYILAFEFVQHKKNYQNQPIDLMLLQRKLNKFFTEHGFTPSEKPHFQHGIKIGLEFGHNQQIKREPSTHYV